MTTADFGQYVSQIGKYPAAGASGWVFKVNGASPPVGADQVSLKDGDVVLWYYATFGAAGGPPTLELQRLPGQLRYVVQSVNDAGKRARAAKATLLANGKRFRTKNGRGCVGKHSGTVCAPSPRVPSARTPRGDSARAQRADCPRPSRPLRWRRRWGGGDGDALGSLATVAPLCSLTSRSTPAVRR